MKKIQMLIFIFFGLVTFIVQLLGIWIILTLWGIISHNWALVGIIGFIYLGLDLWRHFYYKHKGYTVSLGGYKTSEKKDSSKNKF